jgi:hypothetical protein
VKIVFTILVLVHGLIHLIGFVKSRRPDQFSTFSKNVSAFAGFGWLLAAVLFIWSAVWFYCCHNVWWMLAVPAVILSQFLIFLYWFDAKFGTPLNGLILLASVLAFGSWNFTRGARNQLESLIAKENISQPAVAHTLPAQVEKWLARCAPSGNEPTEAVWLSQSGSMRTTADGKWMHVYAKQWYNLKEPAFIWLARVKIGPGINLLGRDSYTNGRGHMLIKAAGLISVADSEGPETDQGTLLRYLGEMVWFPNAAREPYITWEPVDSLAARATMTWKGVSASGIFRFTTGGEVASFEANRYYDRDGQATLEKWVVSCEPESYRQIGGARIPTRCEVVWKLKEGDFSWFRLNVLDVRRAAGLKDLPRI